MSMFCYQCQESSGGTGCSITGVCGKTATQSKLQDLILYSIKGIAVYGELLRPTGEVDESIDYFTLNSIFMTITNSNFNDEVLYEQILKAIEIRDELKKICDAKGLTVDYKYSHLNTPAEVFENRDAILGPLSKKAGVLRNCDEDVRSLKEMIIYGLKGVAAYTEHAYHLGHKSPEISAFIEKALLAVEDHFISIEDLISLSLETGKFGVKAMELLDEANTKNYGHPEITKVNIGVGKNPGILVSGHDYKDLEQLLEQTKGTGVDVYTHSEMLPAHYYPAFKKYSNFIGNYGGAWWEQTKEFKSFNGPILFTSNCIVPPKGRGADYKKRVFTTNSSGLDGAIHIPRKAKDKKDFSEIINLAKKCDAPSEIETGEIIGGFAHNQVLSLADKIVEAVKSGSIKKFVVMAGCDGRMNSRKYYTEFAKSLPTDTVILTAGCAKYRYNKLDLGDIDGIPRVLDAGQCNDSYSLVVIATKLQEAFGFDDINDLPIVYNIAWYEQKAVIVLLALLHLGVKDIHLGPTLPAFLSPNITTVLSNTFGLTGISTVSKDMKEFGIS